MAPAIYEERSRSPAGDDGGGISPEKISRTLCRFGRYPDRRPRGLNVSADGAILLKDLMWAWGRKHGLTEQKVLDAVRGHMFHDHAVDDSSTAPLDGASLRFSIVADHTGGVIIRVMPKRHKESHRHSHSDLGAAALRGGEHRRSSSSAAPEPEQDPPLDTPIDTDEKMGMSLDDLIRSEWGHGRDIKAKQDCEQTGEVGNNWRQENASWQYVNPVYRNRQPRQEQRRDPNLYCPIGRRGRQFDKRSDAVVSATSPFAPSPTVPAGVTSSTASTNADAASNTVNGTATCTTPLTLDAALRRRSPASSRSSSCSSRRGRSHPKRAPSSGADSDDDLAARCRTCLKVSVADTALVTAVPGTVIAAATPAAPSTPATPVAAAAAMVAGPVTGGAPEAPPAVEAPDVTMGPAPCATPLATPPPPPPGDNWKTYTDDGRKWYYYEGELGQWFCTEDDMTLQRY